MAGWIYPVDTGESVYATFSQGWSGVLYDNYSCEWRPGTPKVQAFVRNSAGYGVAIATAAPTEDQWNHVAAIFTSSTSRAVFVNGGNKGTNSDSVAVGHNPDLTGIGCYVRIGDQDWFEWNGRIAEVGFWNVALTDEEVAVLAKGYSPLFVRPQNLVAYWPLIREGSSIDNMDIVGKYNMDDHHNPTDAPHCRIIYPSMPLVGKSSLRRMQMACEVSGTPKFLCDVDSQSKFLVSSVTSQPKFLGDVDLTIETEISDEEYV